jgi:acyl-CoA thioesterase
MLGAFDRDTAVQRIDADRSPAGAAAAAASFAVEVSPDWRAGRGPHGGYLAAMLLRALTETVADAARPPRSLTIHYARAPEPGPAVIHTVIERGGRSLSTLSARMEQEGSLVALALAAFSVPWTAPEIQTLQMPAVAPPDPERKPGAPFRGAPSFTHHIVVQPRLGTLPFTDPEQPMEIGAWLGLAEPRAIDALSLAFYCDAMFPSPFVRLTEFTPVPTVDLTIHFRTSMPRVANPDPNELCLAHFSCGVIHDGFFEEDGIIWAADGAVLAQSRQLGIVMGRRGGGA